MSWGWNSTPYVSAAQKRLRAQKSAKDLEKDGRKLNPGNTTDLIVDAATTCYQMDEKASSITLLKKMYAALAAFIFDRVLEIDKKADKKLAKRTDEKP